MTTAALRRPHLDTLAVTLLVLCCAFWGFQQSLIKIAAVEMPPLWQATVRFWCATALLWAWCHWRGIALWEKDGSLWPGLLAGGLFAAEFTCIYLGLQLTSASRLTVFLYCSPFVVAVLLPRVVPGETLRRVQWLGLLIAFGAMALAFSEGFLHGSPVAGQWRGDLLGLCAAVLWGLTTLTLRATVLSKLSAEKTLFYQIAVTAAVSPLVSLALGEAWGWAYSLTTWTSVALQTVVGAFASYLAWMWMLRHYPATQMSTFTFLTPVFALLFGMALLGEPFTWRLGLALAGVAAGIVLVSRR